MAWFVCFRMRIRDPTRVKRRHLQEGSESACQPPAPPDALYGPKLPAPYYAICRIVNTVSLQRLAFPTSQSHMNTGCIVQTSRARASTRPSHDGVLEAAPRAFPLNLCHGSVGEASSVFEKCPFPDHRQESGALESSSQHTCDCNEWCPCKLVGGPREIRATTSPKASNKKSHGEGGRQAALRKQAPTACEHKH